ncbi:RING finger protein 207-like isoform X4 [Temnothorax curvispinosus]|uniref:RING finger protein 207 n=1 Tax=Temnothorax curvispinosus TaxID=300111 RepID=A0A6J1PY12_9HYME|nr:RING finger protein 207-like isoform X4 [Temnothorax curvispinosus]
MSRGARAWDRERCREARRKARVVRARVVNGGATQGGRVPATMASSGSAVDGVGDDGTAGGGPRNPLTCGVCHNYFNEPCLLSCFHTFCARCLHGPHIDGTIKCPLCGQQTQLKDGAQLPPPDQLIRQLVELANSENPPCANCDKRDKSTMFFCTTCGQALCTHCREHTHRAKMFSTHEVVHMSKCAKDTQRRCPSHGEQYIMFSQSAKCMLCTTCFRDTPPDARVHCVDIESAWQQASKKMERAVNSICELQAGIKDGVMALKSQLDELRHSLESEKRALTAFCHGMQEAITKTHAYVLAELQRQFDSKERMVRSQLLALGGALPVLQMHLMLCTAFTTGATKYQFLELAHPMLERLSRVAQLGHPSRPPLLAAHIKTTYRVDFARALHPYIGQVQTPKATAESLYDQMAGGHTIGQSEPQVLQSSKTAQRLPPKSGSDGGPFSNHCRTFDTQLKDLSQQLMTVRERLGELQRDVSVLKKANTPPLGMRYDHVARDCRLLEQQLEHHQMELERLRNVFDALWEEQMCRIHIEKEIFHSQMNDILSLRSEVKKLQIFAQELEPFVKSFSTGISAGEVSMAAADAANSQHLQALLDHLARIQMQEPPPHPQAQAPTKDHRHLRSTATSADNALYMKETKEIPTRCRTPSGGVGAVLDSSGNIVVYGTAKSTDPKRGVLSQLIEKARTQKDDRKKSPGREDGRDRSQSRRSRKSPDSAKPKTPPGSHSSGSKMRSLYRSLKGGTGDTSAEALDQAERCTDSQQPQSHIAGDEGEYQRISEASSMGDAKKRVQAQVHAVPADDQIRAIPSSKVAKIYPASDSEELFYGDGKAASDARRRRRASCDSLSTTGSGNSRRSSIADGTVGQQSIAQDPRKTLVVLIESASRTSSSLMQKQRSWETFPRPKSKRGAGGEGAGASSLGQLKKADSFEGHEEAVRTLVAAVHETRSQRHHHLHHHRHHRKSKTN